ncbi:RcpC/CpaB family pilus assembly protein [Enterovibrio norvegicus]|uniref:pilus assembly protein CpaB n=1 Tax=Enterovibrio norvegicus TaxID=188144 RepID=UPI000C849CD3|nr:pilus assembly protein CpaB [Enterovibrio norvegicus]PML80699.1 pilus assembly protein CpaB [Enterovibrio norvegicus]
MSQRIFFLFAILVVFIGLLGLSGFFQSKPTNAAIAPSVVYRVAQINEPLSKGQLLKRQNIRYIKLTEEDALKNGISNNIDIKHVPGMVSSREINSTEFISPSDFLLPNDPGYLDAVTREGMTPYPLKIRQVDFIGMGVNVGDLVDIIILTSDEQNISNISASNTIKSFRSLAVSPLFKGIKVLAIDEVEDEFLPLTIELDTHQIAKMVIARRIGIVEIIKTTNQPKGQNTTLNADTHDVLPNFQSVIEIRGQTKALN